jgi:hypothetical protein
MAGEICPVREDENQSGTSAARARVQPWEPVPEKALTITEADRFTRRGGTHRVYAIHEPTVHHVGA